MLDEWRALVRDGDALMCGPVRQEVLSGVHDDAAFAGLRTRLRWFPDEPLFVEDFEEAARVRVVLQRAGVSVSPTDAILCALALRLDAPLYSSDADFARCARHLRLRLHAPR